MFINFIKKYLSKSDLQEISEVIKRIEKNTSGELRLCVKYKTEWHEKNMRPRDIAIREFHKLGMHDTINKTGVLVMILLKDRKFEIIADEGINSKVKPSIWEKIAEELTEHFSKTNFKIGIINLLTTIGGLLAERFPPDKNNINELPDDVVIEK
jgi:uncharacterized membrane protein